MKKGKSSMDYVLEINNEEIVTKVFGTYYAGHAGSYYDPPEAPEVIDLEVIANGKDIVSELEEDDIDRIVEAFIDWNEGLADYDAEEAWRMRNE
jgi:hypothetical protein